MLSARVGAQQLCGAAEYQRLPGAAPQPGGAAGAATAVNYTWPPSAAIVGRLTRSK